jgi:SPX domain protein involved in polyphosphate accumulation
VETQQPYSIASLYFDTADYKAYWDKINGHRSRRKVRVRVYGDGPVTPETVCFLEVKQRIDKRLRKRRVALPYAQAVALDELDEIAVGRPAEEQALLQEVAYLYRTLQLRPTCVVRYQRLALEDTTYAPDLRITFDCNLRCRMHDLSLLSNGLAQDHFFWPPNSIILEVKVNYSVPTWLVRLLNAHHCTPFRISKYCTALEQSKTIQSRQQLHLVAAR